MNSKPIVLFLCTPRCGTQWFAKNLGKVYSNKAIVTHEPVNYYLRENLYQFDKNSQLKNDELIEKHLKHIEKISENKIYIEVGWQGIAGISKFYDRFSDRLKIVHLYRNPIHVAASLVTHNWYTGKVVERSETGELTPFDKGAALKKYSKIWDDLNTFEKSLYFWTEINFCALAIKKRYPDLFFYSFKFEDIFKRNKETSRIYLKEMLAFTGLEFNEELIDKIDIKFDEYRYTTNKNIDWKDIHAYPQTMELATRLGYDLNKARDLSRYMVSKSKKIGKNMTRRLVKVYSIIKLIIPI